jgi:hypothetical protein
MRRIATNVFGPLPNRKLCRRPRQTREERTHITITGQGDYTHDLKTYRSSTICLYFEATFTTAEPSFFHLGAIGFREWAAENYDFTERPRNHCTPRFTSGKPLLPGAKKNGQVLPCPINLFFWLQNRGRNPINSL